MVEISKWKIYHIRGWNLCFFISTSFLIRDKFLCRQQRLSQQNTGAAAPGSPGPHSPASPGPHATVPEPASPRLPSTPPPLPPRRRRDSPEISSPLQVRGSIKLTRFSTAVLFHFFFWQIRPHSHDLPALPPKDSPPPPLPPRREPGVSPNSHHHVNPFQGQPVSFGPSTMPRLNPTHTSQLHIRRHYGLRPSNGAAQ